MRLALACGDQYVHIPRLEEQIDIIISNTEQNIAKSKVMSERNKSKALILEVSSRIPDENFSIPILLEGFRFLVKYKPTLETAQRIVKVHSQGQLSIENYRNLAQIWEDLLASRREDDLKEWSRVEFEYYSKSPFKDIKTLEIKQQSPQQVWQQVKRSEQVFLEAILRIANDASIAQQSQEFIYLGVLFQGMNWWEAPSHAWAGLGLSQDLEAVDAVLRGASIAMELDPQKLAAEAKTLLGQTHLDDPEIKINNTIFGKLPRVPASPKWERVKHIELSIQALKDALDHPSALIKYNAGLILVQKIGEAETLKIMSAKNILNAE